MADCINPRWVKVRDAFSGRERMVKIRCGRCANCLAAEQDEWATRISESCVHNDHFIFCTLTFRPEFFRVPEHCIDVSDAILNPDFIFSEDVYRLLHYWDDQINNGCFPEMGSAYVPCFDKSVLSAWIKRGRERYFKDTGQRLHFKYIFTSELGPRNSRPHAHGIVIGLSKDIFRRYFADLWFKDFGYYDLQYIRRNPKYASSCVAVSRYISKYINKGYFESPLIKEGLVPKCWRMVSNGIGEELLLDSKFKIFQDDKFKRMVDKCRRIDLSCRAQAIESYALVRKRKKFDFKIWTDSPSKYVDSYDCMDCASILDSIGLTLSQLKSLFLYVDDNSYYHALPRYYRYKLLGREPNLFKYAVQAAVLAHARERYNKELLAVASSLECSGSCKECEKDDVSSVRVRAFYLAGLRVMFDKQIQAIRQEQRYFTHMKNHYNRPKSYRGRDIRLLQ